MTLASVRDIVSAKRFAAERTTVTAEQMHVICLMLASDGPDVVAEFRAFVSGRGTQVRPGNAV